MYACECSYVHVLYVAIQQQLQLSSHHTVQTVNTTSDQSVKCKFLYDKKIKLSSYICLQFFQVMLITLSYLHGLTLGLVYD